jgi:hypothetical protein
MTEINNNGSGGGGNNGLYFIVGGLVVVCGLGAFLYFGGMDGSRSGSSTTTIERTVDGPDVDLTIKKEN